MPNARVGVMPPPPQGENLYQEDAGRGRGGRQPGITMQDLKKQTAVRLAQEQHQLRTGSRPQQQVNNIRTQRNNVQPQAQKPSSGSYYRSQSHNLNRHGGNNQYTSSHSQSNYQQHMNHYGYRASHERNTQGIFVPPHRPQNQEIAAKQHPGHPSYQSNNYYSHAGSHSVQADVLSESSSVPSDFDCNTDISSVSGTSAVNYHQTNLHRNANPVSSLQAASGVKTPSTRTINPSQGRDLSTQQQIQHSADACSKGSTSSNCSNRSESAASSTTIPASVPSRVSNNHLQHGNAQGTPMRRTSLRHSLLQQPSPTSQDIHHLQYQCPPQQPNPSLSSSPIPPYSSDHHQTVKSNSANRVYYQQQQHQLKNQPKLPHGLTVHELKEMTRARLAREAASGKNGQNLLATQEEMSSNDSGQVISHLVSTPNIEVSTSFRSQAESSNRNQIQPSSSHLSMSSLDSWHRSSQQDQRPINRFNQSLHSAQTSSQHDQQSASNYSSSAKKNTQLLQSQQSLLHQPTHGLFREQNRPHLESVDSSSVASFGSTINSEYLGAECVPSSFLGPQNRHKSNDDDMLFKSWSFPSSKMTNNVNEQSDAPHSSSSFFDTSSGLGSVGGARRRLGSAPGYYLEVAHEDRPLTIEEELSAPLYNNDRPQTLERFSYRSKEPSNNPPVFHDSDLSYGTKADFEQRNGMDFNIMCPPPVGDHSRAISSNGELPNWVAESVLGTSMMNEARKAVGSNMDTHQPKGNADAVFRSYNASVGFSGENDLISVPSNGLFCPPGGSGSWGGSTSVMSGANINELLNQDFSKLLSLHSIGQCLDTKNQPKEETNLRSSNFVSRIDPEVLGSPTSIDGVASSDVNTFSDSRSVNCDSISELPVQPVTSSLASSVAAQRQDSSSTKKRRERTRRKRDSNNHSSK